MSIVHNALKRAEAGELKKAQLKSGLSVEKATALKKPPIQRVVLILVVFFALLLFTTYFPEYYINKKVRNAKESIAINPVQTTAAEATPTTPETESLYRGNTAQSAGPVEKELEGSMEELNSKGIYFFTNGDYASAEKYFTAALKKDRSNHEFYNNLALTLKKQGNYKEALKYYEIALSFNEDYKEGYNNIGVLYDQLNQYDSAVKSFTKAISLDKDYADPHFNIAGTYEKMNEYKFAIDHYQKYLKLYNGEDAKLVTEVEKKIDFLKRAK